MSMSEEEKKAIEKTLVETIHNYEEYYKGTETILPQISEDYKNANIILNLIDTQQETLRKQSYTNKKLRNKIKTVRKERNRLQKELEYYKDKKQLEIDTAEEVLKWKGIYHLLSRKINGVLEDKIKNKIKELKEQLEHTNTMEWQEIIKKQIQVLEDSLKESDIE